MLNDVPLCPLAVNALRRLEAMSFWMLNPVVLGLIGYETDVVQGFPAIYEYAETSSLDFLTLSSG